jgi:hypothetical protein
LLPTIGSKVEEPGVSIPFTDMQDSDALFLAGLFDYEPTQDALLQLGTQGEFSVRQLSEILCFIEP